MRHLAFVVTLFGLAIGAFTTVQPATANQTPNYLADCSGVPVYKPSHMVLACADGGIWTSGLVWRQWGSYYAYASGKMQANDCTPDCADGHFRPYTIDVAAFGRQRCPNGEVAYAGIKFTYRQIFKVAPYRVGDHTYRTKFGPIQTRTQEFPCSLHA